MTSRPNRRREPGASPGTYDRAHVRAAVPPKVTVVDYDAATLRTIVDEPLPRRAPAASNRWIHVSRRPSLELLEHLRVEFDLDRLALEDVVSVDQRPKIDVYERWRFLTLSVPGLQNDAQFDEFCLFFTEETLISFFSGDVAVLDPIRRRLERTQGNMRRQRVPYLVYSLIDLTIDLIMPRLDSFGDLIASLESEVLDRAQRSTLAAVHSVRNRLLETRRLVWATRERRERFHATTQWQRRQRSTSDTLPAGLL